LMVSVSVAVWLVLPLVPLIVIVYVPFVAVRAALIVSVELPAPVIDVGLKLSVVPDPCPVAVRLIADANPPVTAVLTVTVLLVLCVTVFVVGDTLTEKPAVTAETERFTVVVETVEPEVPVMVIGYVPVAVVEATVSVSVELPFPVIEPALKLAVTPVGNPEAVSVTAELNPPVTKLEIDDVPADPGTTVRLDGDADKVKPLTLPAATSVLTSAGVGLPHPVTRS